MWTETFGLQDAWDAFAEKLHEWDSPAPPEMLDMLASLARGGRVVDLGAGYGRVCVPLAAKGVEVDAIDFAPFMLRRLREAINAAGVTVDVIDADFVSAEPD